MKRIVVLWGILFGLLPLAHSQVTVGGVTFGLALPNDQLLPDEKMHLKVSVDNQSGQDFKLGNASDYISFIVTGEKGTPVKPIGTNEVYTDGEATIPAGKAASREFNLTPAFDFRQPGHYYVKATIHIPQWNRDVATEPLSFTVVNPIPLANLPNLQGGSPLIPHPQNSPPEVRRYRLEKADTGSGMNLYVRVTDGATGQTVRLVPAGPYFGFRNPDVRLDQFSALHLLHQTGAKDFSYYVIDALGQIMVRQTYQYVDNLPVLQPDDKGTVAVAGGVRKLSESDLPPNEKQASAPRGPLFPGSDVPALKR